VIGDILQPTHLLFILVIALIVLGPKRLPEVGRSLGKGLRDFRVAMSGNEETEQLRESLRDAHEQLQETHETLQQPMTMEPVAAQQPVAAGSAPQPPLEAESVPEPASPEHTAPPVPANGDQSGDAPAAEQQPTEVSTPVEEPAERPS
jgi:sec-independent protein translocase protein TatA